MNEEIKNIDPANEADQTPSETAQSNEQSGSDAGKLFTQEELERIIKKRLKRVEARTAEEHASDYSQRIADLDKRENDLKARESKLQCKEYILEKGYSADLAEILDISDFETFKEKADRLAEIYKKDASVPVYPSVRDSGEMLNKPTTDDNIRKAFLSKGKHIPKEK